jgi:hypothetical protein
MRNIDINKLFIKNLWSVMLWKKERLWFGANYKRYSRFFMIGINAIRFYGEMAE